MNEVRIQLERDECAPRFSLDIHFRFVPGTVIGIVGASGSGKSSLLRCVAGLEPAARGRVAMGRAIWLDSDSGIKLASHKRGFGLVRQSTFLFPFLSAIGNLRLATKDKGLIAELLDIMELEGYERRLPSELSGGQARRVHLAQALARLPEILLLDEAFSGLDACLSERVKRRVLEFALERGMSVLMATHDIGDVVEMANAKIALEGGRVVSASGVAIADNTETGPMFPAGYPTSILAG